MLRPLCRNTYARKVLYFCGKPLLLKEMIACKNLHFSYPYPGNLGNKNFNFPDISCHKGETLLILGGSGKGKTTFLHLMGLLLRPESGEIVLDQQPTSQLSSSDLATVRAQKIGIIYQRAHFIRSLTVMENILMANYLAGNTLNKEKARALAFELGFGDHLDKKTQQLSQGEQQRVGIARAVMNNPAVLLADEPTSSLDDENCEKVISLLKKQSSEIGASLIVVTHDQRLKDQFTNRIQL